MFLVVIITVELGINGNIDKITKHPSLINIDEVTTSFHTLVITTKDELYSFGNNCRFQLGSRRGAYDYHPILLNISNIVDVACGDEHSLLLDSEGQVYSFGYGYFGQLGHENLTQNGNQY